MSEIMKASEQREPGNRTPETVVQVRRPGLKANEVLVSPLPSHSSLRRGGDRCSLHHRPGSRGRHWTGERLRELFGLTPAEIRVCMALVDGKSVEEYAHEAGVSSN